MTPAPADAPVRLENREGGSDVVRGDEGYEATFAGYVEGVEAEQLAGAAHFISDLDRSFIYAEVQVRGFGNLDESAREPATCEVAEAVDLDAGVQQGHDGIAEWGAVAQDIAAKLQPLAHGHDRDTMPADVTAQEDGVARLDALRTYRQVVLNDADAGGVDEDAVGVTPVYHFGVAGDQLHVCLVCCQAHGLQHAPEGLHGQALFEYEAHAEVEGPRAAHCEIVYGAVHGEGTDVAAGEEEGWTTWELVVKARRAPFTLNVAPSCRSLMRGLEKAGTIIFSINLCMRAPPPP